MKKNYPYTIYFVLVFITSFLYACKQQKGELPSYQGSLAEINALLLNESEEGRFSGTIVIGNKDKILYEKAFGIADRQWDIPMNPDYAFDIASVNKSMIAALLVIADHEGRLRLNGRLVNALDSYSYSGSFDEDIRLQQLLTHTSGLPDYNAVNSKLSANNYRAFKRKHFDNEEYVDFISQLSAVGEPGEQFHYSNFAYHLACIILEDAYEVPFGELLEQKILRPLDMRQTYSTTDNSLIKKHLAEGYLYENGDWERNPFIDLSLGRRVFSTAGDLYKWASALSDERLFNQEMRDEIKVNRLNDITNDISYGLGWVVFNEGDTFNMGNLQLDKSYIIHGGSTDGYKSILININNGEWVISLLANSGNRTQEMKLAQKIAQILNDTRNE